jgi:amino acid transporter
MFFTALSYVTMSRAFPLAGSVYSYASRAMGRAAGFLAGWLMLLDYVLLPALGYAFVAIAMQALVPGVPRFAWILFGIFLNTTLNFLGIEATARFNKLALVALLVLVAAFALLAFVAVERGVAGARWSSSPFLRPANLDPAVLFGALSLAALSFLGFDAISTLAEESAGGASAVGRATVLALFVAGILFVAQTYLASLFVLGRASFPAGEATDAAFYDVAATIGGPWLRFFVSAAGAVVSVIGGCLTAQAATARLIYGMARDGRLPRALAHVHPRRKVPDRAILLVAAVNLIVGFALANRVELLTSMVNFGALTGFLLLHVSVIVHFGRRQRSRSWLRHLLAPAIGFAIVAYVLINMAPQAKIAGGAWLLLGCAALLVATRRRARLAESGPSADPEVSRSAEPAQRDSL